MPCGAPFAPLLPTVQWNFGSARSDSCRISGVQHARRTAYILPAGSCMGQLSALALSPHWSMAVDCATTRCKDRDRHSRTCRLAFWQAEAAWIHSTVANLQCIQCSSSTSRRRADLRPVCGRLMTDRKRRNVRIQPSNRAHASPHAHRVHILTAAFVSRSRTATAPVCLEVAGFDSPSLVVS